MTVVTQPNIGACPAGTSSVRNGPRPYRSLFGTTNHHWLTRSCLILLFVYCACSNAATNDFRIGISYSSFGTVSRNDASAALKAWAVTVARERKLGLKIQVEVFEHESELRHELETAGLDAASMTAEEFIDSGFAPDYLFVTAKSSGFGERFAVVVHRSSAISDLAGLRGRKLARHQSPATSPALTWLGVQLAKEGFERPDRYFREVVSLESPSKSVLQVFFHQSDACLVTTSALAVACELNPQLARDLKTIAVSPLMIPSVFFLNPNNTSSAQKDIEAALLDVHSTPSGQQVLTVFQGSHIERHPLADFAATKELLRPKTELDGNATAAAEGHPQALSLPEVRR